jgi:hypothetical protein
MGMYKGLPKIVSRYAAFHATMSSEFSTLAPLSRLPRDSQSPPIVSYDGRSCKLVEHKRLLETEKLLRGGMTNSMYT